MAVTILGSIQALPDIMLFFDSGSECRCGDDANVIKSLDESSCNSPCDGDPSRGMCGGICPAEGPGIANVYTKTDAVSQESSALTSQATSIPSEAPESVTSSETSSTPEAQQTGGLISPAGPAPEAPSTFTSVIVASESQASASLTTAVPPPGKATTPCSTEENSALVSGAQASLSVTTVVSLPEEASTPCPAEDTSAIVLSEGQAVSSTAVAPPPGEATTPCPSEGISSSEEPAVVTVPQTTGTCSEDANGFTTSVKTSVPSASEIPTTVTPAMYTSDTPSAVTSQGYPDPQISGQQATEKTTNSTSDPTPESPNYVSASTLWTRLSDGVTPTGHPPVPAQVTGSDSTHSMVPPLATIGGLALIAAFIV
ncbi:hypothetical protein E4U24_003108 [Claviceps purpurea]|nr:hypothetical protein E4U24_003108 [Claviceps purpurea]KAG6269804.1 hypothetical protein E4U48_004129 [Claviceps purpurea]KAG6304196.1 hypothetical protein E4U45_001864 [Claviceps purpurea]